jgi:iron complex outermembrane receptor protein
VADAVVRIVGTERAAVTRPDGTYRLRLRPGRYVVHVTRIGYAPHRDSISLGDQPASLNFVLTRSAVALDPVVAVGNRDAERTVTKSAVPVDVVTSDAIESMALSETWEALQRVVPSINVPRQPLADDLVRPITLRGLSPGLVLVLVNGKRRHITATVQGGPVLRGTSPVDINAIPQQSIDRIEVLRDGAAAQYGSDAIAGVVNVILKSGPRNELTASYGSTFTSEGGRNFRDGLARSLAVSRGTASATGAHLLFTGEIRDRGPTNRAYPDARPQYFDGDPRNANPPRISSHIGDASSRHVSASANGGFPLGRTTELYGFGIASHRLGRSSGIFFRRARESNTVRSLHPDGFLSKTHSRVMDVSLVAGVRGEVGDWRWDLSSGFGMNSVELDGRETNNVSLGDASPTEFYLGALRFGQWTTNLNASRALRLPGGAAATLAAGAEARVDHFRVRAGEPDSYRDGGVRVIGGPFAGTLAPVGAQGLPGYRPEDEADASRHNIAAYIDLESQLTTRVLVSLAGRAERYSDFGSTADAKVASRVQLFPGVSLRASAGTGFQAPSLIQSFHSTTSNILRTVDGVPTFITVRTLPANTEEARILGAKPLVPEQSLNASGGLTVDMPRGPTLTLDFYAIDVDDKIVLSETFDDPLVANLFEARGLRGIGGGRYFTNAVDTRTRGLDLVANKGFLLGGNGLLRVSAAFNRTKTRVTRVSRTPPELEAFQSVLFGRAERARIELGQPHNTINITVSYSVGRLGLNLHNQRFGDAAVFSASDPARDQYVTPKWITDLSISYRVGRRLRVAASAANLFDVYPDEWSDFRLGVNSTLAASGVSRYPGGISQFGMNGRTLNLRVSWK